MKRILALVLTSTILMVVGSASAAQITPTLVLGGSKIDQTLPSANATYVGWAQNSIANPKHYDAFYETLPAGSGSPVMLNVAGTSGYMGSLDGDTTNAVFQEAAGSNSDIELYDLTTHVTSTPPAGINTNLWEWRPSLSQGFIEFGRNSFAKAGSPWKVMAYNPNTTSIITLATEPNSCRCLIPGQVSPQYATWTDCLNSCNAYFYSFANQRTHKIPNPLGDPQYNPSVDPATGTFYYARSGLACGAHAKIMRWTIGDAAPTVVASLPAGYDAAYKTFDYVDQSSNDNVFFDRLKCGGSFYSDIYEIGAANTASPTLARVGAISKPATGTVAKTEPQSRALWEPGAAGALPEYQK